MISGDVDATTASDRGGRGCGGAARRLLRLDGPDQGPDRRSANTLEEGLRADNVATLHVAFTVALPGAPKGMVFGSDGLIAASGVVDPDFAGVQLRAVDPATGAARWTSDRTYGFDAVYGEPVLDTNARQIRYGFGERFENVDDWRDLILDSRTGEYADSEPTDGATVTQRGPAIVRLNRNAVWDVFDDDGWIVGEGQGGWVSVAGRTLGGAVWVDPPPTDPPTTPPEDPEPTIGTDHLWLAHGADLMGYRLDTACPARPQDGLCMAAWVRTLDGRPTRVVVGDEGVIHLATDGGTVYALDGPTGGVLWSTGLGDGALTKPALAGGRLYVAGASRTFAVDAITGDVLWRSTASTGAPTASPVVAGDVVYSSTGATGVLKAHATAGCESGDCAPLWTATAGSPVSHLLVASGRLYGLTANALVAYQPAA